MNMSIEFSNCEALPEVEMAFMNTVHCEELKLVSGLVDLLEQQGAHDDIATRLSAWVAHTHAHFEREEKLMNEYRFPPCPIHKMEHEQALESLLAAQKNWLDSGQVAPLLNYIKHDWRQWLQQHIMTMDRVTAHFFSRMGVEVQL